MSEPRFDDAAMAAILRRAAELQAEAGDAGPGSALARRGLNAAELRQIAGEAGIAASFVDAALAERGATPHATTVLPPIGAAIRYRLEGMIIGDLERERRAAVIAAIRRAAEHQGEVVETSLGVEWRSAGEPSQLAVNLTPRRDGTAVEVVLDRGGAAVLTGFLTFIPWFLLIMGIGASLNPTLVGGLAIVALGLTCWLVSATAIWRWSSARWRARLTRILGEALAAGTPSATSGGAALPAADEPADEA